MARQQDNEDLVDYYKRFVSLVEIVDRSYGTITPVEVAKKDATEHSKDPVAATQKAQDCMLAFMFMDGADKRIYRFLLNNISNDHTLGTEKYLDNVEEALQVLLLYGENFKKKKDTNQKHEQRIELSAAQLGKMVCWKCGEKGHKKQGCPKQAETADAAGTANGQQAQALQQYSWMA